MAFEQPSPSSYGSKVNVAASRIEVDIETIKALTTRVDNMGSNISRHTRSLGYSEHLSTPGNAPEPVITTLSDALRALERAIERCTDSVSVFG